MAEVIDHKPNTPCWLDLASPDLEGASRFYGGVFGWEAVRVAGPEMGNYTFFKLRGKDIAGLSSLMTPGQPSMWNIYIASKSVDQTAELVKSAGGSVLMGPDDIPQSGRIGFFSDPAGAVFGVWQPAEHKGAGLVQEADSFAWAELSTRDVSGVTDFYRDVFGWGAKTSSMGPGMPDYTEWILDSESISGSMPMQPDVPAKVPPFWLPYFQVVSADRSSSQVKELGGNVLAGPMDFPGGRFAVLKDPFGAAFGLLEMRA